jgi:hypothetical protein
MENRARNFCAACNDMTGHNTNHEPAKCCLRCRNFDLADKLATDTPREDFLRLMEKRPNVTGMEKLLLLAGMITMGLNTRTDKA